MLIKPNLSHGTVWLRLAALYFVAGAGLGLHLAASGDAALSSLHGHLGLLGWVSMALFGILYRKFPAMGASPLASIHFWLYNLALPLQMVALIGLQYGYPAMASLAAVASVVLFIAVLLFALNVFRNAGN